jgi:hypothetical protein
MGIYHYRSGFSHQLEPEANTIAHTRCHCINESYGNTLKTGYYPSQSNRIELALPNPTPSGQCAGSCGKVAEVTSSLDNVTPCAYQLKDSLTGMRLSSHAIFSPIPTI